MKKVFRDFIGIFLGIIVGIAIYHFYINFQTSSHKSFLNTTANNPQATDKDFAKLTNDVTPKASNETNISSAEFYLCEISDFYESLITVLYSTIGILLVVSFIYVYTRSRSHAEEMAREALKEEAFLIALKDKIQRSFTALKNEGEIADLIEKTSDLNERIEFLEKAITKQSYEINSTTNSQDAQGEKNSGDNKKA